jgi:hypothetical protein
MGAGASASGGVEPAALGRGPYAVGSAPSSSSPAPRDAALADPDTHLGLQPGDQIAIERSLYGAPYMHHGIYIGAGQVVHYRWTTAAQPANHPVRRTQIRLTSFEEFVGEQSLEGLVIVGYPHDADPPQQVVARALSLLGEGRYNGLCRNCEHFARFCKTGTGGSGQITQPLERAGSALQHASRRLSRVETAPMLYAGAPAGPAALLFPPSGPPSVAHAVAAGAAAGCAKVTGSMLELVTRGAHSSDSAWRAALRRQAAARAT